MQQKWNQNFDGEPMTDIPQKFLSAGCDVYMVMQPVSYTHLLDQPFYCCSAYRKYGAKACDSHYLEARVPHEAVFADIQAHTKADVSNREALVKKIANPMHLRVSSDRAQHKRDVYKRQGLHHHAASATM